MPRRLARRAAGPPGKSDVGAGGTVLESPRVAVSACVQASSNRSFFFLFPFRKGRRYLVRKIVRHAFSSVPADDDMFADVIATTRALRAQPITARDPPSFRVRDHPMHYKFLLSQFQTDKADVVRCTDMCTFNTVHFQDLAVLPAPHTLTHTSQANKQTKILVAQEPNEEPWRQCYKESKQPKYN